MFFFIFITKNTNDDGSLFLDFENVSFTFTGNSMFLKSSFLVNCLSAFVSPAGLRSAEFKYLIILHLKHSLSSLF